MSMRAMRGGQQGAGRAGLVVALGLAAGQAVSAHAAIFTFSQQCASPNWFGECTTVPCVPSGTQTFNNWGQTGCAGGLALPGAGDTADISGGTVTLNGTASVLGITSNTGTNLTWTTGNLSVGSASALNGTMAITGAVNRTLTGSLTNAGTWSEDTAGSTITMSTANLTNTTGGIWTITNNNWTRAGSTANSFTNAATFQKAGPASVTISGIAVTSSGALDVLGGTLTLAMTTFPLVFQTGSTTTIVPSATLAISAGSIAGPLLGANNGTLTIATPTLGGAFTYGMTGGPLNWNSGNMNGGGNTMTVNALATVRLSGGFTRSITGATIVNNGNWVEDTGGFATSLSTVALTNNGSYTLVGQSVSRVGSSSNSITNNGTWTKTGTATSTISSIAVNHNGTLNVSEGAMAFNGTFPFDAAASSITNIAAGATMNVGCAFLGELEGANDGIITLNGMSLAGSATINTTGPGQTQMQTASTNLNSNTLTIGPATSYRNLTPITKTFSGGTIINNGNWIEDTGGFTTNLSTVAITNNGTYTLVGQSVSRFGSSTNSITNNGTWSKTGAATSTIQSIAVNHNGTLNVSEGTIAFNGTFPFTAAASSITNIAAGATMSIGCPLVGEVEGANNGIIALNGMSMAGSATINAGPGQTQMQTASTNLNGHTLTVGPATNYRNLTPVTKGFSGGSIVNNGNWLEATGGFTTTMSSVAVTNNAMMALDGTNWSRFGSSVNTFTNNATFRKIGANAAVLDEIGCVNNALWDIEAGTLSRTGSFTYVQNPGATLRVRKNATASITNSLFQGGTITGLGTLGGTATINLVTAAMTITPGDPGDEGGTLTLQGNLQLSSNDALNIELDARPGTPADTDRLNVSGQYQLDGAVLNVSLAPGFVPTLGDQYTIVNTNVLNPSQGTFGTINYDVPAGVTFSVSYFPGIVRLTVTGTTCDGIDINNDASSFDPQDIEAFLSVYGEGPCVPETATCSDIDFNNDGALFDPCDIDAFLLVFSEGPCTLCGV
jgi:hypothetical protein